MIVDIRKSQSAYFRKHRFRWTALGSLLLVVLYLFKELHFDGTPALIGLAVVGPFYLAVQIIRFHHLYTRWVKCNEAWGVILSGSRQFARQLLTLISVHQSKKVNVFDINSFQVELINRQIALVYVMGYWLRNQFGRIGETVILLPDGELDKLRKQENIPVGLLQRQLARLQDAREIGMLDEGRHQRIADTVAELNESFEYCEKVKRTVYPAHMTLLGRLLGVFVGILTILFFSSTWLGWGVSMMLGFTLFYLEFVNSDLENPFDLAENDVPMTFISRMVESDLRTLLGETDSYRGVLPIDGVLL